MSATTQYEYHVLVKGFNLKEKKNDNFVDTDLRHYRFPLPEYSFILKEGAYQFYRGKDKDFAGSFPVNATMVLPEQVKENTRNY